jgi:hypothetical protein
MGNEKFWMVYCPERGAPTKCHTTKESAVFECERLTRSNAGHVFFILEAVEMMAVTGLERRELV